MGTLLRLLAWTLLSVGLTVGSDDQQSSSQSVYMTSSITKLSVISGVSPAHNGRVCSTWGNYHFKTFDGDVIQVPSTCNFVLSSLCKSDYEEFNIQMRRQVVDGLPTISKITMKLDGTVVELTKDSVLVNHNEVILPYSQLGVLIEPTPSHLKITCKLGLVATWNRDDSFLMEMDNKFRNQTCGLCGDFNGVQTYDEFYKDGAKLSAINFANIWRMDSPTENCEEHAPLPEKSCNTVELQEACEKLMSQEAFSSCQDLVASDYLMKACVSDMCNCNESSSSFCLCNTISEYSRQCVHAGGQPQQWRTQQLGKSCPFNMEYQECGTPCIDTCSNSDRSQLCEEHCTDGCFCPPGTVFDDIKRSGCIKVEQCSCTYNGGTYGSGESYKTNCRKCTCSGGEWSCEELECPGTCSVEGGSHITTFDGKAYSINGQCSYFLVKQREGNNFTVLADLEKCGLSDTETCLKAVSIRVLDTIISIQPNGAVSVNSLVAPLPLSTDQVTIFKPSTFYIIADTKYGLQLRIQLVPVMQAYITLNPSNKGITCGLCGNFNNMETDDFKVTSGLVESTPAAFANTWKARSSCPDIKGSTEDPCSLSVENERYATHWCSFLTESKGPFSRCHSEINPDKYKMQCMHDSCNCEKSEDCMCAAITSYVHACAVKGIILKGWRNHFCNKYTSCPSSMVFQDSMTCCKRTCRSLSEPDYTCQVDFLPVDGCGCEEGTYMNQENQCVPATSCPCYHKGVEVEAGETIIKNGATCTCKKGSLSCFGAEQQIKTTCVSPMVFFNCEGTKSGTKGSECQRSCSALNMECVSTECISGCVCPEGLVADGMGGCVKEETCPCIHNGVPYQPGSKIKVSCNKCTCKKSKWECTSNECHGTCAIYGDGNYITFDEKRFRFSGGCEYTLTQDYCSKSINGTFRVVTENVPCGTTGTTCSKAIKLYLEGNELVLAEGKYHVIQRETGSEIPFKIRTMGIYLVVEANNGLILIWDRKTSMFIKLAPTFEGRVCGLCGNYDGNGNNDFTTRSQAVVANPVEFGNSWKVAPTCPDAELIKDPCTSNPYRQSWAQKQCSIINSRVFSACHSQVDPGQYYDACVSDSCACDSGGDCECFCTAVASYAQACNEAGVCVAWRTPQICPLFCDYYNGPDDCEWHYKPCGAPCVKTCRNPSGICSKQIPALEGCYPKCPADKPFLDEDTMKCVPSEDCGCYDEEGNHYTNGQSVPSTKNCETCYCAMTGVLCSHDDNACYCIYKGNNYPYGVTIYNTTDGDDSCITAVCGKNGTIERDMYHCATTTTVVPTTSPRTTESTSTATYTTAPPTTVFVFSTTGVTSGTTEEGRETSFKPVTQTLPIFTLPEETTTKYSTLPQTVTTAGETKSTPGPTGSTEVKPTPSPTAPLTTEKLISTTEKIQTETTKPPTETTTAPIIETSSTTPISEITSSTTEEVFTTPVTPPKTTTSPVVTSSRPSTSTETTIVPPTTTEVKPTTSQTGPTTTQKPSTTEEKTSGTTEEGRETSFKPVTQTLPIFTLPKETTTKYSTSPQKVTTAGETKSTPGPTESTEVKPTPSPTAPLTTEKPKSTTEKIQTETTKPPTETTTGPIRETSSTTPISEITSSTTEAEVTTPVVPPKTSTSPVVTSSRPSTSTETTIVPPKTTEGQPTPSPTAPLTTEKPSTTEKIETETTKPPTETTTGPIIETSSTTPISEITSSTTKAEVTTPVVPPETSTSPVVTSSRPSTSTETTIVPPTTTEVKPTTSQTAPTTTEKPSTTEKIETETTKPPTGQPLVLS
ncbi:mucin-5B isoform X2 [Anguilla rostrata]|uniref:mucin-5B isoform X2 n=1 Tax=Anguilla rostrata TaxID=7938 RepID=UPI0030CB61E5